MLFAKARVIDAIHDRDVIPDGEPVEDLKYVLVVVPHAAMAHVLAHVRVGWRRDWDSNSRASLDSVSYRLHNARVAGDASDAVAPCPPLPTLTLSLRRSPRASLSRGFTRTGETRWTWRDPMDMVISRYYHADDHCQAR